MKLRTGFVSNSSSSSFIVFLKEEPKNEHELIDKLFPDRFDDTVSYQYADETVPGCRFAAAVWAQLSDFKKQSKKKQDDELLGLMRTLLWYELPDDFMKGDYRARSEEINKRARERFKAFKKEHENDFVFVCSFSDNDGADGAVMEHGNGLRNVDHVTVSQH